MTERTEICVLVLGYRARPFLEAGSLDSLVSAAGAIGRPTRVIVLDNYSRDGSVQWITGRRPDVDLLVAPQNTRYCGGTNILLQYAHRRYEPRYYVLADADNFVEPNAFRRLLDFALDHPRCGLVQPLVWSRSAPGVLYSCGHWYTDSHFCRTITVLPTDRRLLLDLPSCSIAATLVRADVFERCGLLNPVYEMYYESSDLSFRARSAGWTCACHVDAVAYNDATEVPGPDTMHSFFYFNRNRLLFWRLHDPAIFERVQAEARAQYAVLQGELAGTCFGLGAEKESVRRGLEEGLRLAADRRRLAAAIPRLDDYDKTAAVLLQEGGVITGAR